MANGLRSLKYGIGPNEVVPTKPITREDLQNIGLLAADIISPAHDIKEYQQGVQQTMQGNLWGIPQALTGLLGIAIPGSKYIKQGTSNLIKRVIPKKEKDLLRDLDTDDYPTIPQGKELKVYHGTAKKYDEDIFKTPDNVLFVTRNPEEANFHVTRHTLMEGKDQGSRVYPLRIKENAKIFDPTNDKQFNELMKDNDFKEWLMRSNRLFNSYNVDDAVDQLNPKQFIESFRKNKWFGKGSGSYVENEDLHPILKRHGYDGFTIREAGNTNIGMFLDTKGGSDMLKYLHEKYKGGMIMRDPYKREARFI